AMWEVVNGDGTAGASRLPLEGIEMCGKTGTAQVRRIAAGQRGQSGERRFRDHGLFVFFAPFDNPRYAGAVVIEHGMGG
ncbi:MAG: penicillin-binding transpeptidase domain-containing protein, partial [Gammaproteobacteria bacterium]